MLEKLTSKSGAHTELKLEVDGPDPELEGPDPVEGVPNPPKA